METGSEVCGGYGGDAGQPSELLRALWTPEIAPLFWRGVRLDVEGAWHGHVPFAHWIVRATRPRNFVELGTHNGVSYCAFCEAVVRGGLDARCYAIDTWKGDDHAGICGEDVYRDLRSFHDSYYGAFSELLRCEFDEALRYFPDDSVDLLHINGLHAYEVASHGFESWSPKLSDRAVVLFHDTNVRERDFGVWRLWDELKGKFPSFEFVHAHGLGVLGIGRTIEPQAAALLELSDHTAIVAIRERFALLGERWVLEARMRLMQRELEISKTRVVDLDSRPAHEGVRQAAAAQARSDIDRFLEENRQLIEINRQLQEARDEIRQAKDQMEARAEDAEAAAARARDEMGRTKDQMEARAERAEAAAAQARADVGRRAAELERARAEITELAGRIADRDQLRTNLDQLEIELQRATQEGASAREDAARIQALYDQLLASTVWRATWPIRAIGDRLPEHIHRTTRRAAKLAWSTVTLQLRRRLREQRIGATAAPARPPGETAPQQADARPVMEPRDPPCRPRRGDSTGREIHNMDEAHVTQENAKALVFVHVPKCAGTTLRPIITSHYRPADLILSYPNGTDDVDLSKLLNGHTKCYYGHFYMDIDINPENFVCVSVIRDPVKRIISHYYYVVRDATHWQHRLVIDHGISLADYALGVDNNNNRELDNGQLRQLAGLPADLTIDEPVFAAARSKVLRIYALVGATENLNDFVARLSQLMGWQQPAQYENRNVGNYEAAMIPQEIVRAIRERNKWDQRLYEELVMKARSARGNNPARSKIP